MTDLAVTTAPATTSVPNPKIVTRALDFYYGDSRALRRIELEIAPRNPLSCNLEHDLAP